MYRLFRPTWIAAILLAAITTAHAQLATIKPTPIIPPPQYDHPYKGQLTFKRIKEPTELRAACRNLSSIACALYSLPRLSDGSSTSCTIIMLPDETIVALGHNPKLVLRHENGHCNGWGKDHPMPVAGKGE